MQIIASHTELIVLLEPESMKEKRGREIKTEEKVHQMKY